MRFLLSLPVLALSLFATDAAANPHGGLHARRAHDAIARRAPGDVAIHLNKRFDNARFTFYDVGLGACGQTSSPGDFMVALNSAQYGGGYPGPNCFKQISISYNGKSTTAVILDECPGCPYGGLDLSPGLFSFFADQSAGVIYGTWDFVDGGNAPAPAPSPTPTPTPDPPQPTTTKTTPPPYTPPTTTTTKQDPPTPPPQTTTSTTPSPPPTTSPAPNSEPPKPTTTSTPLLNLNIGPASGLAVPTDVVISDGASHNIQEMNEAIIAIGAIIVAGEMVQQGPL